MMTPHDIVRAYLLLGNLNDLEVERKRCNELSAENEARVFEIRAELTTLGVSLPDVGVCDDPDTNNYGIGGTAAADRIAHYKAVVAARERTHDEAVTG